MLVVCALVLAACGSTLQQARHVEVVGGDGAVTSGDQDIARLDTPPDTVDLPAVETTAPGTADGSGGGQVAADGVSGGTDEPHEVTAGPQTESLPGSGQGYTEDEIYIGYFTWKDVSRAGGALGFAVDYGDQEGIVRTIVNDINARGGIGGRKVVPVFYDYQTSDILANPQGGDEAACARMTVDRPVFAVVAATGIQSEVLPECLAARTTPLIANTNLTYLRRQFEGLAPYFLSTASPMLERFVPIWLERADALGYFGGWNTTTGQPGLGDAKVGILRTDSPGGEIFGNVVREQVERLGEAVASEYAVSSALDGTEMSAAVLRFRSDGVTHVVAESLTLILFPQTAESQRFRPRYAISTAQAPLLLQVGVPRAQLRGALGAGYYPTLDTDNANDPGDPSAATQRCREIMQADGHNVNQREAWNGMSKSCEGFWSIEQAVALGGMSNQGFIDGIQGLRMEAVGAFGIAFTTGRFDGLAAVRDMGYVDECNCFRYLSRTNRPF